MGYVLGDHTGALIITHRLSTVRWLCSKFFVLRHLEGLGPGESQLEASARSFEELYETSSTFRRLADDQGERQPLGGADPLWASASDDRCNDNRFGR
jgi:hypothetical protein